MLEGRGWKLEAGGGDEPEQDLRGEQNDGNAEVTQRKSLTTAQGGGCGAALRLRS